MSNHFEWSKLNRLQIGRYAEYFFKMQFTLYGFDVYSAEIDDRGIDFVIRRDVENYWDVQVKSIRNTGYVFVRKDKFAIHSHLLLALAIFSNGHEPKLFLVPSTTWKTPDSVFVDRNYPGLKSAPEYGINLSKKNIGTLDRFSFFNTVERIFGINTPQRLSEENAL